MLIGRTVDYALRAVVCLADAEDGHMTTHEIAKLTQVPTGYLSKVLLALSRGGIVKAQRGLHGGFSLIADPEDLTALEVINIIDPIERITTCPLGFASHGQDLCALHRRIDDAIATIEQVFGSATIADILREKTGSQPLCDLKISASGDPKRSSKSKRKKPSTR